MTILSWGAGSIHSAHFKLRDPSIDIHDAMMFFRHSLCL